jgi:hypothetical protein
MSRQPRSFYKKQGFTHEDNHQVFLVPAKLIIRRSDSRRLIVPNAVKILIDISPEYYNRILSEFTEESRMYAILKNGLVIHHFEANKEFRTVEILCEKFHARMILAAAEMFCPEAAAEIEEAIRLSRTLH